MLCFVAAASTAATMAMISLFRRAHSLLVYTNAAAGLLLYDDAHTVCGSSQAKEAEEAQPAQLKQAVGIQKRAMSTFDPAML
jgi:hypothetical protein